MSARPAPLTAEAKKTTPMLGLSFKKLAIEQTSTEGLVKNSRLGAWVPENYVDPKSEDSPPTPSADGEDQPDLQGPESSWAYFWAAPAAASDTTLLSKEQQKEEQEKFQDRVSLFTSEFRADKEALMLPGYHHTLAAWKNGHDKIDAARSKIANRKANGEAVLPTDLEELISNPGSLYFIERHEHAAMDLYKYEGAIAKMYHMPLEFERDVKAHERAIEKQQTGNERFLTRQEIKFLNKYGNDGPGKIYDAYAQNRYDLLFKRLPERADHFQPLQGNPGTLEWKRRSGPSIVKNIMRAGKKAKKGKYLEQYSAKDGSVDDMNLTIHRLQLAIQRLEQQTGEGGERGGRVRRQIKKAKKRKAWAVRKRKEIIEFELGKQFDKVWNDIRNDFRPTEKNPGAKIEIDAAEIAAGKKRAAMEQLETIKNKPGGPAVADIEVMEMALKVLKTPESVYIKEMVAELNKERKNRDKQFKQTLNEHLAFLNIKTYDQQLEERIAEEEQKVASFGDEEESDEEISDTGGDDEEEEDGQGDDPEDFFGGEEDMDTSRGLGGLDGLRDLIESHNVSIERFLEGVDLKAVFAAEGLHVYGA